jgi:hypothetical protein
LEQHRVGRLGMERQHLAGERVEWFGLERQRVEQCRLEHLRLAGLGLGLIRSGPSRTMTA